jgi:hypothetical protein
MAIYYPPKLINAYLQQKLGPTFGAVPMYPTMPSDLAAVAEGFTIDSLYNTTDKFRFNGQAAIYDRMFRMRKTPFPYIKSEQVLYYFFALTDNAVVNLIEMTQHIQDLLDRGDDSAQDLNTWIASHASGTIQVTDPVTGLTETKNKITLDGEDFLLPYFHNIKIYQLQETRDVINFATARTFAGNKLIIDYDWHKS